MRIYTPSYTSRLWRVLVTLELRGSAGGASEWGAPDLKIRTLSSLELRDGVVDWQGAFDSILEPEVLYHP